MDDFGSIVQRDTRFNWRTSDVVLRPLSKMQRELSALRDGQQNALNGDYPQEISPLVNDLNALLFHYQELLERARHHAGNLSTH